MPRNANPTVGFEAFAADTLRQISVAMGIPAGRTVHLVLTHHWYDEVASGRKSTEYRHQTARWRRALIDRRPQRVVFHRGYTATTLTRRILSVDIGPCPYPEWYGDYIRVHFEVPHAAS